MPPLLLPPPLLPPPLLPPPLLPAPRAACTATPQATCAGPSEPCIYDPACTDPHDPRHAGGLGCNAGGRGQSCRFCDFGGFLPCEQSPPASPPPSSGELLLLDDGSALSLREDMEAQEFALRLLALTIFGSGVLMALGFCFYLGRLRRQARRNKKLAEDEDVIRMSGVCGSRSNMFADAAWLTAPSSADDADPEDGDENSFSRGLSSCMLEGAARDTSRPSVALPGSDGPATTEASRTTAQSGIKSNHTRKRASLGLVDALGGSSKTSAAAGGHRKAPVLLIKWKDIQLSGSSCADDGSTRAAATREGARPTGSCKAALQRCESLQTIHAKERRFGDYTHEQEQRFPGDPLVVLSTGDAYAATVTRMRRVYMLHSVERAASRETLRQLLREVTKLRTLSHPALLHSFAVVSDHPYGELALLSELATASLSSVLDHPPQNLELTWANGLLAIATDVAAGLAYLHSRGLHHGRLFLFNVLLTFKWKAKLAEAALDGYLHASHGGLGDAGGYELLPSSHGEHGNRLKAAAVLYLPPEKCSGQVAVAQRKRLAAVRASNAAARECDTNSSCAPQQSTSVAMALCRGSLISGVAQRRPTAPTAGSAKGETMDSTKEAGKRPTVSLGAARRVSAFARRTSAAAAATRATQPEVGAGGSPATEAMAPLGRLASSEAALSEINSASESTAPITARSAMAAAASRLEEAKKMAEFAEQRGDAWAFGAFLCSLALHQRRQRQQSAFQRRKAEKQAVSATDVDGDAQQTAAQKKSTAFGFTSTRGHQSKRPSLLKTGSLGNLCRGLGGGTTSTKREGAPSTHRETLLARLAAHATPRGARHDADTLRQQREARAKALRESHQQETLHRREATRKTRVERESTRASRHNHRRVRRLNRDDMEGWDEDGEQHVKERPGRFTERITSAGSELTVDGWSAASGSVRSTDGDTESSADAQPPGSPRALPPILSGRPALPPSAPPSPPAAHEQGEKRAADVVAVLTSRASRTSRATRTSGRDSSTNFEDGADATTTTPYVLMLRVCQGLVSPLDGVTAACCPKPLLRLATQCCVLQPSARPTLASALEQLQGDVLHAVDASAIAGARRPTQPLSGWHETAEVEARCASTPPVADSGAAASAAATSPAVLEAPAASESTADACARRSSVQASALPAPVMANSRRGPSLRRPGRRARVNQPAVSSIAGATSSFDPDHHLCV